MKYIETWTTKIQKCSFFPSSCSVLSVHEWCDCDYLQQAYSQMMFLKLFYILQLKKNCSTYIQETYFDYVKFGLEKWMKIKKSK